MRAALSVLLIVHGLIHLLGVAKALGWADLPQLKQPVSPGLGLLWLTAAVLFLAAAGALWAWPRWWWALATAAVAGSFAAIIPSWADAKYGALINVVVLGAVVFGFLVDGPSSLRAAYDRDVRFVLAGARPREAVTETDLAKLPPQLRQYLRRSGVVGRQRVGNLRARMHGRIRSGPDARWMPFTAEQYNSFDEPARLFYMTASMIAIPAQGYHRYVGPAATMRVKAAGLVSVVDVAGPEMNQGETVTMLNDMCILAPAALIDARIDWAVVDSHTVRARFTNAGQTVSADLSFDENGDLTNFWSDDRYQASPDGRSMHRLRWSTPLGRYRSFDGYRLSSGGEGRWHDPGGEFAYIELTLDDVQYNLRSAEP